jgi:ketosteroid isomerase-like protein
MSNALTIGTRLVNLCDQGKNVDAVQELYADDVVSIEAVSSPGLDRVINGKEAVLGKNTWWIANHEIHDAVHKGPYPHGPDRFAVFFSYDATSKEDGKRTHMDEVGLYTVAGGKIVKEEFFYQA